jgi:hypothetical protein
VGGAGGAKRLPGKENGLTSSAFSSAKDELPAAPTHVPPHRRTESRGYDRYGEQSTYGGAPREAVPAW